MEQATVVAQQDCPARTVPAGVPTVISAGTFVNIRQALGGNYTVTVQGNMLRVDGSDAHLLGLESQRIEYEDRADGLVHQDQVEQALRSVYDPEIPINLIELGLIYGIEIHEHKVEIVMTLTSPTCGMGPVLVSDVKYRVGKVPNVQEVSVRLVFEPPWGREKMSEAAQLEAGLFF